MTETPITHEEIARALAPIWRVLWWCLVLGVGSLCLRGIWGIVSAPFRPLPDGRTCDWRTKDGEQ